MTILINQAVRTFKYISDMAVNKSYASVALVTQLESGEVGIESIFIDSTEVILAGAWTFEFDETEKICSVLQDRLIIFLDEQCEKRIKCQVTKLDLNKFIQEANEQALLIQKEFDDHLATDPKKYAKLKSPELKIFKGSPNQPSNQILRNMVGEKSYAGLDPVFGKLILAAREVRKLVLDWQHNEMERTTRKYLSISSGPLRILPEGISEK